MSVALNGTAAERLRDAIAYSERNRRRVARERARVRRRFYPQIIRQLRELGMDTPTAEQVDALLDRLCADDSDFKTAVANEQWGGRLAQTYGLVVIAEQNDRIIALLTDVAASLRNLALEDERSPG